MNLHVRENDSGANRTFNLQSMLPSGLTLVPGSAKINSAEQRPNLSIAGNTLTIAGTQVDPELWPADYVVTTRESRAYSRGLDLDREFCTVGALARSCTLGASRPLS